MKAKSLISKRQFGIREKLMKMIKCVCSREQQLSVDELNFSSESLATRDYSATASGYSSHPGEKDTKVDNSNLEEAESSLRESGYLNYEEARALLGRLEYQKGNTEAALHVFEGIDIAAVIPKIKISISRKCESNNRGRSQTDSLPPMSMHAVSLLLEAILLKAKSLHTLGRFQEAAQSCKTILDTLESAMPEGWPENFVSDCKLQETVTNAVELLPELWKLAGSPQDVILSYRRALLYHWNLGNEATARIQKEFALFLLFSGCEASPPALRAHLDGSFVPGNNIEEAILLLLILLRKSVLGTIVWDPSIIDHLSFALSISGEFMTLAHQVEELLPETMERKERYYTLALCYCGEGEHMIALDLLRNFLNNRENLDCIQELLLASKICVSQWHDAEICLAKSQTINPYSASRWHSTGLLYEARGLNQEALKSFKKALDIEPNHVASLISTASILRELGGQSSSIVRSLLTDALRLDRTNASAWYNLGLLNKADLGTSALEAAECFEAAVFLEESSPIEPFR